MKKIIKIKEAIYNMRTRNDCIICCVKEKLDTSFYNYNSELETLCGKLLGSNSTRVLNNIIKNQKKEADENGIN